MKYLPIDVSDFKTLISSNFIYVDKTKYIYDLFGGPYRYYFLSRPRRFGKSLFLSTLKEFFLGNKQIFEGLWISHAAYYWPQYPIIFLDFSMLNHRNPGALEQSLNEKLLEIANSYNVQLNSLILENRFAELVQKLAAINRVAILIDEYDSPIVNYLNNLTMAEANRDLLGNFFRVIKGLDQYIRAVFITGVSRFAKTSVFSGINNLNDISMNGDFAQIVGYSESEMTHNFEPFIKSLNQPNLLEKLKYWYNGYRFSEKNIKVYNPFSVLYFFYTKDFKNFWFRSGTPTFLINLLRKQYYDLADLQNFEVGIETISSFEVDSIPLLAILYQTGYLTIVDYNSETNTFKLDYPNEEVKQSFQRFILLALTKTEDSRFSAVISRMRNALINHDAALFCELLQSLFAHIPYLLYIKQERYFHSLLQLLASVLGLETHSELMTDKGRIDFVVTTPKDVYLFELKFNSDPELALQQILDRKYYERYKINEKRITLIGLNFKFVDKQLDVSWQIKSLG